MYRPVSPHAPDPHALATPRWRPPPAVLRLGADDVHLWRLDLEDLAHPHLLAVLSADERERAARLFTDATRRRFAAARAALRHILARYLATTPAAIRFVYGVEGKPALAAAHGSVQFNLSHSQALALCAVARERAVGVDVERVRSDVRVDELARRFFSAAEAAALIALPAPLRREAFFASWARKEAWIKATGTTIWRGLRDAAHLPTTDGAWVDALGRWYQIAIDAGPGYAAALVAAGGPVQPACWTWQPAVPRR